MRTEFGCVIARGDIDIAYISREIIVRSRYSRVRNSVPIRNYRAVESERIRASTSVIPRRSVPEGHRIFRRWHREPRHRAVLRTLRWGRARVLDWNINIFRLYEHTEGTYKYGGKRTTRAGNILHSSPPNGGGSFLFQLFLCFMTSLLIL